MTNRFGTRARLAAGAVLLLSSACAAGSLGARSAPGTVTAGRFAPGRPPAASYGPDPAVTCSTSEVLVFALAELQASAERAGRNPAVAEGRVCAVADAFLAWDTVEHGMPRPGVLAFTSHWFGLPGVVQPPSVAVVESDNYRDVAQRVVEAVGGSVLNSVYPRLGLTTQLVRRGRDKHTRVSVVVLDSPVELDPIPRRLDLGQEAKLAGRLLGGVKAPQVLVSDATGRLSEPPQQPGTEFQATVQCGDRPGTILVEIRGEYEGSPGVVATFPIACGKEPPVSVAVADEPWPSGGEAAARKILEMVNAERVAVGLHPLVWDEAVAQVAKAISEDLAARAGAPGGMDVGQRLKREGIAPPLILQSAVAERTVEGAHKRLLGSPSNRANILSADVTNFGVGTHETIDDGGRKVVYVTEVFIKEPPPVDVASSRQELRDAVAQKRRDARAPGLEVDDTLGQLAQRYAEALAAAAGTLPKEQAAELKSAVDKAFRSAVIVSGARREPLDLAEEPQMTSSGKVFGVGIAQGSHPVLGRNAVYAVIMIATPKK